MLQNLTDAWKNLHAFQKRIKNGETAEKLHARKRKKRKSNTGREKYFFSSNK